MSINDLPNWVDDLLNELGERASRILATPADIRTVTFNASLAGALAQ